jgi:NADH-quinone oxidoreductase subunit N
MNAIVLSAVWGVVMMFTGILSNNKRLVSNIGILGMTALVVVNLLEMSGMRFFTVDLHNMLWFDTFGLLFNTIAFVCTLVYFLLSGRDIERVGSHVAEYYALTFFVLCGVSLASSFNTLLMLFLAIEIISIPLYVLTGSNKRNLKSNEASLKY